MYLPAVDFERQRLGKGKKSLFVPNSRLSKHCRGVYTEGGTHEHVIRGNIWKGVAALLALTKAFGKRGSYEPTIMRGGGGSLLELKCQRKCFVRVRQFDCWANSIRVFPIKVEKFAHYVCVTTQV